MRPFKLASLVLAAFAALAPPVDAGILMSAESFAILGGSAVTNAGATTVIGDVGVFPGSSITGTGTITLTGAYHANDSVAQQAQADVATAYNALQVMASNYNLSGQDLGGKTLTSGVYTFDSSAQLTGSLVLDAQGNNNAFWVFQIGSTLMTASASSVSIINVGSNNGSDNGLFWAVGSSATLGTNSAFEGNILASASITVNTAASIHNGRLLAQTGAVTLDTNTVTITSPPPDTGTLSGGLKYDSNGNIVPVGSQVPEPSSLALLGIGGIGLILRRYHRRSVVVTPA